MASLGDAPEAERPTPAARGTLASKPFSHLLVYAMDRRLTGSFELAVDGQLEATLQMVGGLPAKIRTRTPIAYLGQVLYEQGVIDQETLNASLMDVATRRALHGRVLVERGAISEPALRDALLEQTARKLRHLFTLPDATEFAFFADFDLLRGYGGPGAAPVDPLPVLWRALRDQPPTDAMRALLQRVERSPCSLSPHASLARFRFDADELALAECLRARPMGVREFAGLGVLVPRQAELLYYVLLITRQIDLVSEPRISIHPRPANSTSVSSAPPPPGSPSGHYARPLSFEVRPQQLSAQLAARRQVILERAAAIAKEDHFEVLGVGPEAPPEEAQRAFFRLAEAWHPDRLPAGLDDVREACAAVFARLSEAHNVLSDERRRQRYLERVESERAPTVAIPQVRPIPGTANLFEGAEVCASRKEWDRAEAMARKYLEEFPNHPAAMCLVAWAQANRSETQPQEMTRGQIRMIDKALARDWEYERGYHWRALLWRRLGDELRAVRDFRAAATLNPRNVDAAREVRLHEMRAKSGKKPPERTGEGAAGAGRSLTPPGAGRPERGDPGPEPKKTISGLFNKIIKR